jgi:hypothetical protein
MEIKEYSYKDSAKKWLPSLIILPVAVYLILNRGHYTWIDNADLVIHEAGHVFFMFFGEFIHFAGGTLMQILLPLLIAWYFFRNMYRTGLQVSLLWLGQNFINISVYAADARSRVLPLLGGNKAGHDWHYMLGRLNLLEYDHTIGYIFWGISILIFITALLMPLLIKE